MTPSASSGSPGFARRLLQRARRAPADVPPAPADLPAMTLDRVSRSYGATRAVDRVSLEVRRGEMLGLIGPDGAGKTTLIRLIAGLIPPTEGRIGVLGHDPVREHRAVTRRVGYLSQRFSLYGDLSIDENIAFFAEIHGVRHYADRRDRLLDLTQLTPYRSRLADRLSGGMKQKLALACTLVHQPDLILLDEPTTGVDPVSRREFWKLLSEFLHLGLTIVIATPYLDEAERCARVALLYEGRLLALDDPARLRAGHPGELFEVLADPFDRAATVARSVPGVAGVQQFGERIHLRLAVPGGEAARSSLAAALAGAGLDHVRVRQIVPSLEDVFIERIERASSAPAAAPVP
jgi:ABC-2 type transport system ATP-binding protein